MNMGAYSYIAPRIGTALHALGKGGLESVKYVSRPPSAATATGFPELHAKEQKWLVQTPFQKEEIPFYQKTPY